MARVLLNASLLNNEADSKISEAISYLDKAYELSYLVQSIPEPFEYKDYIKSITVNIKEMRDRCLNIRLWTKKVISNFEGEKYIIMSSYTPVEVVTVPIRVKRISD